MEKNLKLIIDKMMRDGDETSMKTLVDEITKKNVNDDDIGYLADRLANSGYKIDLPSSIKAVDIPSTGGPSSLSTVVCPLLLRMLGFWIPKLGVPGRPAGGIDILAQIPGYKIRFGKNELITKLKKSGYIHFIADENYAPMDAKLFAFRKKIGALDVYPLVIASILSKKLVGGLKRTGLDIRVAPYGNFGRSWNEAKSNAKRFCKIAKIVGIKSVCFLTDARFPFQPYIGRGEALIALSKIFNNDVKWILKDHLLICYLMALSFLDESRSTELSYDRLKYHFEENLKIQNSTYKNFEEKAFLIQKQHKYKVLSPKSGFLKIDLNELRGVLVWGQLNFSTKSEIFPDPCGIILKKTTGDYVKKKDIVATFRSEISILPQIKKKLTKVFVITNKIEDSLKYEEVKDD